VVVGVLLAEEEVASLVIVAGEVRLAFGVWAEDPHAAASSRTPTANTVVLVSRTALSMVAHLLPNTHCRAMDPGVGEDESPDGQPRDVQP